MIKKIILVTAAALLLGNTIPENVVTENNIVTAQAATKAGKTQKTTKTKKKAVKKENAKKTTTKKTKKSKSVKSQTSKKKKVKNKKTKTKKISVNKAINIVFKYLREKEGINTAGYFAMHDGGTKKSWMIRVFQDGGGMTFTHNFYYVNKTTGKVKPMFDY